MQTGNRAVTSERVTRHSRRGQLLALVLVAGLVTSTSSCSWVFVSGPDDSTPISQPVSCTTSFGWPALDVGLMLANLITGAVVGAGGEPVPAIGFTFWALIHALALNSGVKRIDRCQKAKALRAPPDPALGLPGSVPPSGSVAPPGPVRGTEGGTCYGNATCNDGLTCDLARLICVGALAPGTPGGACYGNGTCNAGLTCDGAVCR